MNEELDRNTLIKELNKGKTRKEIAEKYGCSQTHISTLTSRYGLEIRPKISQIYQGEVDRFSVKLLEDEIRDAGFDPDRDLYYDTEVRDSEIAILPRKTRVVETGDEESQ